MQTNIVARENESNRQRKLSTTFITCGLHRVLSATSRFLSKFLRSPIGSITCDQYINRVNLENMRMHRAVRACRMQDPAARRECRIRAMNRI